MFRIFRLLVERTQKFERKKRTIKQNVQNKQQKIHYLLVAIFSWLGSSNWLWKLSRATFLRLRFSLTYFPRWHCEKNSSFSPIKLTQKLNSKHSAKALNLRIRIVQITLQKLRIWGVERVRVLVSFASVFFWTTLLLLL